MNKRAGFRAVHQKVDGYSASVSRTMNAPLSALYDACADETKRVKWIGRKTLQRQQGDAKQIVTPRLGQGRRNARGL